MSNLAVMASAIQRLEMHRVSAEADLQNVRDDATLNEALQSFTGMVIGENLRARILGVMDRRLEGLRKKYEGGGAEIVCNVNHHPETNRISVTLDAHESERLRELRGRYDGLRRQLAREAERREEKENPRSVRVWRHIGKKTVLATRVKNNDVYIEVEGGVLLLSPGYNGNEVFMSQRWLEGQSLNRSGEK